MQESQFYLNEIIQKEINYDEEYLSSLLNLFTMLIHKIDQVHDQCVKDIFAVLTMDDDIAFITEELEVNTKRLDLIRTCIINTQNLVRDATDIEMFLHQIEGNNFLFDTICLRETEARNKFAKVQALLHQKLKNQTLLNSARDNFHSIKDLEHLLKRTSDKLRRVEFYLDKRNSEFLLTSMKDIGGDLRDTTIKINVISKKLSETREKIHALESEKSPIDDFFVERKNSTTLKTSVIDTDDGLDESF
jgi:hypothetical protein